MMAMVMMMNCTINPPTPFLWQALSQRPAPSAQKTKKEHQAGHSPERVVEGRSHKSARLKTNLVSLGAFYSA